MGQKQRRERGEELGRGEFIGLLVGQQQEGKLDQNKKASAWACGKGAWHGLVALVPALVPPLTCTAVGTAGARVRVSNSPSPVLTSAEGTGSLPVPFNPMPSVEVRARGRFSTNSRASHRCLPPPS